MWNSVVMSLSIFLSAGNISKTKNTMSRITISYVMAAKWDSWVICITTTTQRHLHHISLEIWRVYTVGLLFFTATTSSITCVIWVLSNHIFHRTLQTKLLKEMLENLFRNMCFVTTIKILRLTAKCTSMWSAVPTLGSTIFSCFLVTLLIAATKPKAAIS